MIPLCDQNRGLNFEEVCVFSIVRHKRLCLVSAHSSDINFEHVHKVCVLFEISNVTACSVLGYDICEQCFFSAFDNESCERLPFVSCDVRKVAPP